MAATDVGYGGKDFGVCGLLTNEKVTNSVAVSRSGSSTLEKYDDAKATHICKMDAPTEPDERVNTVNWNKVDSPTLTYMNVAKRGSLALGMEIHIPGPVCMDENSEAVTCENLVTSPEDNHS